MSRLVAGLLYLLTMGVAVAATLPIEAGVSSALAGQRAAALSELEYDLHLEIPRSREQPIRGRLSVRFDYRPTGDALQLDFREQPGKIQAVAIAGQPVDYQFVREHIVLPADSLKPGHNTVTIEFEAGDSSLNRNDDFLYSLFVPDRARTAFPLFDQPDLKARFRLGLTLPHEWYAIASAPLESREQRGEHSVWQFARSEPISSYLFSFVAGRFKAVTRTVEGRELTLLHRETDTDKVARNLSTVLDLHATALRWMEDYTGMALPFRKLDIALIPAFQYGGMEHVGAIQYRASSLWLEAEPTQRQQLNRASLIAHEVAHMWFGNLVTMKWFNDVWTKEVFANFMAAKMVNPTFPAIDHDLSFLAQHYPDAYAVDRSAGANPIRQQLDNLNQAGQMYGAIIYKKAPIMMRQLELIVGEQAFREGMREYLRTYAYVNATWPDLIRILDKRTESDLTAWSAVWVNTAGRPGFALKTGADGGAFLLQSDPAGDGRIWPQRFDILPLAPGPRRAISVVSDAAAVPLRDPTPALYNADGMGYGLFPADLALLEQWQGLSGLQRGSALVNLYDNVLEGKIPPEQYLQQLVPLIGAGRDPLLLDLALDQIRRIHTSLLPPDRQRATLPAIETALWQGLTASRELRRQLYEAYAALASSPEGLQRLAALWSGELQLEGLQLSETDRLDLAAVLAIRLPGKADWYIARQLEQTENPDNRNKLRFVAPSLSADAAVRDRFFASLADERNRQTESWVLDAVSYLHHPSRVSHSNKYLRPSLELLEDIQVTGDIFFPVGWLRANLGNHNSQRAVKTVMEFLSERPAYNPQLRMKILQAVDLPIRASKILVSGNRR